MNGDGNCNGSGKMTGRRGEASGTNFTAWRFFSFVFFLSVLLFPLEQDDRQTDILSTSVTADFPPGGHPGRWITS